MQEMMKLADKQKRVSDDGEGPSFVNRDDSFVQEDYN
jgi:hypothetical protein